MAIIYKPIITEKSSEAAELKGVYGFFVNPLANKIQIRKEIEKLYTVQVSNVRTMNCRGKQSFKYTKTGIQKGRKKHVKKAFVELSVGETIDHYRDI